MNSRQLQQVLQHLDQIKQVIGECSGVVLSVRYPEEARNLTITSDEPPTSLPWRKWQVEKTTEGL